MNYLNKLFLPFKNYYKENMIFYSFLNNHFFRNWYALLIAFVCVPVYSILLIVLYQEQINVILPSAFTTVLTQTPFWIYSALVIALKKNSIIEKFFIFSKKTITSNSIPVLYFFPIILLTFLWNLLVIYLVTLDASVYGTNVFSNVNWGELLFSTLLTLIMTLSLFSLMYVFINNLTYNTVIAFFMMGYMVVFSGQMIPLTDITSNQITNVISYLCPYRYTNGLFVVSTDYSTSISGLNNPGIFGFGQSYYLTNEIVLYEDYDLYLNVFIPIAVSIVAFGISLNTRMCKRK